MITAKDIDWSKAPEDATHFCTTNECWYRYKGTGEWADIFKGVNWEESLFDGVELTHSIFIPRPSQQTIQVSVQMNKPPIGLMPKSIWIERMQMQRRNEITAAMQRYIEAGKDIPNEWLQELIELNIVIRNVQTEVVEDNDVEPKWIEWGVNEQPLGLEGKLLERQYRDGEYRKGGVNVFTWNTCSTEIDGDTVARYRILGDEE